MPLVRSRGFEPQGVNSDSSKVLDSQPEKSGAESGALPAKTDADASLTELVRALAALPEDARRRLIQEAEREIANQGKKTLTRTQKHAPHGAPENRSPSDDD